MVSRLWFLTSVVFALTVFAATANPSQQAHDPSLPDGATDVNRKATLGWQPGDYAQVHHVFLSTDYDDVAERRAYEATVHGQDNPYYEPGPLLLGRTYYWAIYEQFGITITPGPVWQFTVQESRAVEDMESYSNNTNYIFDTWLDGAGNANGIGGNGTGSVVNLSTSLVHGGAQSMHYAYNNSGERRRRAYSEAKRTFDPPQNWVSGNEKALALHFYGSADNDTDPMYLVLDDGNVSVVSVYGVLGEDPNDVKKEEWQEWNIDLEDFISAGLDLSNVVSIAVGFGDRDNSQAGGLGIVHFDDIRLCPTRCVPRYGPVGDASSDCVVDVADIEVLAAEWLNSGNSRADVYPDNRVNFKDYAEVMNSWSDEKLWPLP